MGYSRRLSLLILYRSVSRVIRRRRAAWVWLPLVRSSARATRLRSLSSSEVHSPWTSVIGGTPAEQDRQDVRWRSEDSMR